MTREKEIQRLELEKAAKQMKIDELQRWLTDHIGDPLFETICGDKRLLEHRVYEIEFKIQQLIYGKPTNGMAPETVRIVRTSDPRRPISINY